MTSTPESQWRIDNASHLKAIRFQFRRWTRRHHDDPWDHDHCAACWAKFAEFDGPDIQHEGFTTCDDYKRGAGYEWICQTCFVDLQGDLEWTVADG
jgi:hypothetical protein